MLISYARVSTHEQTLDLQFDALAKAGCDPAKTYMNKISSSKARRPYLEEALGQLRAGDTFVVWHLDCLGRSLQELIGLVNDIQTSGANFKSLTENTDTTTANGKIVFHVFGAFAEYERNVIQERTHAGLAAARARGRLSSRPWLGSSPAKLRKIEMAKVLHSDPHHSIEDICETLHISRSTFYRWVGGGSHG